MNVLILGGAGFVGANLVRRCVVEKATVVTVVDSLDRSFLSSRDSLRGVAASIRFEQGDLCDPVGLARWVDGQDIVYNCAAQSSHPLSMREPMRDLHINCRGNLALLEALRLHNPSAVVIYPSSSTVVGRASVGMIDEKQPERPRDIYSLNKGIAEKYYHVYHLEHGIQSVCLRFPNLYGPYGKGAPEFGFVNYFIQCAWDRGEIPVYGAGDQARHLLYIEDAVELLWRAASTPALVGRALFAAGREVYSVRQVAETIVDVFQRGHVAFTPWPAERQQMDVASVAISSNQLEAVTDWRPRVGLREGLTRTLAVLGGGVGA
ncbi:MAG: NAD(P)-dependent oxidoreductase [Verrucomicrobia bacterium]|nr:NAD(P)-dependent oxidoreductase [Verrucomicrobiota bacterium]